MRTSSMARFCRSMGVSQLRMVNRTFSNTSCKMVSKIVYRVEAGKIAGRWGFAEPIPPRDEWRNGNHPL